MATFDEIEAVARQQLADALKEYPGGCSAEQMRMFLRKGQYPSIAWAIATGEDFTTLINNELQKHG